MGSIYRAQRGAGSALLSPPKGQFLSFSFIPPGAIQERVTCSEDGFAKPCSPLAYTIPFFLR